MYYKLKSECCVNADITYLAVRWCLILEETMAVETWWKPTRGFGGDMRTEGGARA